MSVDVKYRTTVSATGGRDGHAATKDGTFSVNLAAPVVLHTNNRLGRQIINDAHGYAVREPLFGEVELGDVQATTPRVPVAAQAR